MPEESVVNRTVALEPVPARDYNLAGQSSIEVTMRKSKSSKVSSLAMLLPAIGIPCSILLNHMVGPTHPWVGLIAILLVIVAQIVIFYIRVSQSKKLRAAAKV